MSIQTKVDLRSRKLGVLIRDARLALRRTIPECAKMIGVTPGIFRAWEEGRRAPSLPELEVLSYALNLPLHRFWGTEATSDDAAATETLNLPSLIGYPAAPDRGTLRNEREAAGILAEYTLRVRPASRPNA